MARSVAFPRSDTTVEATISQKYAEPPTLSRSSSPSIRPCPACRLFHNWVGRSIDGQRASQPRRKISLDRLPPLLFDDRRLPSFRIVLAFIRLHETRRSPPRPSCITCGLVWLPTLHFAWCLAFRAASRSLRRRQFRVIKGGYQ